MNAKDIPEIETNGEPEFVFMAACLRGKLLAFEGEPGDEDAQRMVLEAKIETEREFGVNLGISMDPVAECGQRTRA